MSKCATEPVTWDTWMRGLTDWQGMMRAMMKLANPTVFMNWMMAPMNPATYQPMMQMMNPAWHGRWMTAMMNPTFYQPIFSLADPNWYAPRFAWMMNPRSFQPLWNAFAPRLVSIVARSRPRKEILRTSTCLAVAGHGASPVRRTRGAT